MKEYKLTGWPDLPAAFRRTAYRRMVSELSQRHVSEAHLTKCSGATAQDVRDLLDHLAESQILDSREAVPEEPKGWRAGKPWAVLMRLVG